MEPTQSSVVSNQQPTPVVNTPSPKNNITVISMAVFILLSLSVVIFLYYQNQQLKKMLVNYQTPELSPTPIATTDPMLNWKTYIYPELSYSFRLPSTYDVVSRNLSDTQPTYLQILDLNKNTSAEPSNDPDSMVLSISKSSFEKTLKYEKDIMKDFEEKNITIDNNDWTLLSGINDIQYLISKNGNVYLLSGTNKQALDQILSAFEFIEPTASPLIQVSSPSAIPVTGN